MTSVGDVRCSCCGEDRDPDVVAALGDDRVQLCRTCLGWLAPRADSTPILP